MFRICIYGSQVLRTRARPVVSFDDELRRFVERLTETMYAEDGVGLAANQVGHAIRVAVIDTSGGENKPCVLVNPEITWRSVETLEQEEGCLSVPDIRLKVSRPASVTVKAFDAAGVEFTIDRAEGLLARALQHEIDHLDGIMFVDRVSPLQRQLVAGKLKKMAKEQRDAPCGT